MAIKRVTVYVDMVEMTLSGYGEGTVTQAERAKRLFLMHSVKSLFGYVSEKKFALGIKIRAITYHISSPL